MTLSRVTEVEDLANLLALRRALLRERTLREQAYWRLINVMLKQPEAGLRPTAVSRHPLRAA